MRQIIQEISMSVIDPGINAPKRSLVDTKLILDEPAFENSGQITIPSGPPCEFYEVKNVNFLTLISDTSFDILINNMVLMNTNHFSFVNRTKQMTISIQCNPYKSLCINFTYGTLKLGNQDVAMKMSQPNFGTRWDRVLKNIIIESNDSNTVDTSSNYKSEYSNYIHYNHDAADAYQFGMNPGEQSSRLQPCLNVTNDNESGQKISHIII